MNKWIFLLAALFISSSLTFAADPTTLRADANGKVATADRLMREAVKTVERGTSYESARVAISLFAQAGQLFQEAATIYQGLVPQYASQEDVDNCVRAMKNCIDSIEQIKKRLQAS